MSKDTTFIYTYTDPRYFDGDPFEVAEKAVVQADECVRRTQTAVQDAEIMARNAEMTRNLWDGRKAGGAEWPQTPQGTRFAVVLGELDRLRPILDGLKRAAGFNPRNPPKA